MGEVYKAEDLKLGRHVALKFLAAHLVSDPEIRKRFEREAGAVGGTVVDHENLRGTIDVFAQESRHLFERSGQPLFFVVGRDDDGKAGKQGGPLWDCRFYQRAGFQPDLRSGNASSSSAWQPSRPAAGERGQDRARPATLWPRSAGCVHE